MDALCAEAAIFSDVADSRVAVTRLLVATAELWVITTECTLPKQNGPNRNVNGEVVARTRERATCAEARITLWRTVRRRQYSTNSGLWVVRLVPLRKKTRSRPSNDGCRRKEK